LKDLDEASECVVELGANPPMDALIEQSLNHCLDGKQSDVDLVAKLYQRFADVCFSLIILNVHIRLCHHYHF
jgi:hypothetical protein